MTALSLSSKDVATIKADAVVVGVAATPDGPVLIGGDGLPNTLRRSLVGTLEPLGVTGAADQVLRLPTGGAMSAPLLVLTGIGRVKSRRSGPGPEALRRAAGAAVRELAGCRKVAIDLPTADDDALAAVCEGALLGGYAFLRYRTRVDSRPAGRATASAHSASRAGGSAGRAGGGAGHGGEPVREPVGEAVVLTDRARTGTARAVAQRAEVVAAAVHRARDLVNTAPVDLYPAAFAEIAQEAAADIPISVTVLDERKLARGGYGGLLGVGMGSSRPPRLVRLDYAPDGAPVHLALVGKGITFDSGGLSIKPAQGMEAMKSDMAGAAAVLQVLVAAARLALPIRLTGWLALAENMPSGTAQRPSDVLTIRGGRTVEVLNTDAEGRLVLADALVAASESQPDVIIDIATLTGAQMVALGNRTSAIMANDDDLRDRLHRVAEQAGEQFWPMPLPPDLRSSMDSAVADIANMGERYGGMLVAGLFLQEFVGKRGEQAEPAEGAAAESDAPQIPWAHLDIAGPAFNSGGAHGYTPTGGTGVGVRTLLALAEELAATGV